ncbi:MAG: hypothetical protein AAFQ36_06165 [Pseudomonadota bacterium]
MRESFDGFEYRAEIFGVINEFGETQKYNVILYREPLTARERRYARNFPAAPRDPASIRVFLYTHNLALGIDAQTDAPVSNRPINLSMGL